MDVWLVHQYKNRLFIYAFDFIAHLAFKVVVFFLLFIKIIKNLNIYNNNNGI